MESRINEINFYIELPLIFDHLRGQDTDIEMVLSNTLQPLRLFYSENIVSHSRAVIFVNDKIDKTQNMRADELKSMFFDDFVKEM